MNKCLKIKKIKKFGLFFSGCVFFAKKTVFFRKKQACFFRVATLYIHICMHTYVGYKVGYIHKCADVSENKEQVTDKTHTHKKKKKKKKKRKNLINLLSTWH